MSRSVQKILQEAEVISKTHHLSEQDRKVAQAIVQARWGLMSFRRSDQPGSGARCKQVEYKKLGLTYDECMASIEAIKEVLGIPDNEITCKHAHGMCLLVFHEPSRRPTSSELDHAKEHGYYAYTFALIDEMKAIAGPEKGRGAR